MDYVVQEGDTLSDILYNITGDGTSVNYEQVAASNNIENPDSIRPGQVIHIDIDSPGDQQANVSENINMNAAKENASSVDNHSSNESTPFSENRAGQGITENNHASNYASSQPSESTVNMSASASSSPKQGNGRYKFTSSLEDDDDIQMNTEEAINYINGVMDNDLGIMCNNLIKLIDDLTTMQNRQYSKTGTKVDQDYLDFEVITEAISDFLVECNRVLDDINSYILANERILNS